jgi:hypothetical protein
VRQRDRVDRRLGNQVRDSSHRWVVRLDLALTSSKLNDRALVSNLLGRALLCEAAEILRPHGIALLPLKGVWLQRFVYADPGERAISDVDVLIEPARFAHASAVLLAAGWHLDASNVSEASFVPPGHDLPLDLHRRLFTRGAFRMPATRVLARARWDAAAFGCGLLLPDPLDVLAHVIGHALKSRGAFELRDIPRLASACAIAPAACAARLDEYGLGRCARFVLPLTASEDPGEFGPAVLRALRPDRVGVVMTEAMRALRARTTPDSRLAALPGFALESSLARGALALGLRAWDKRHDYQAYRRA